MGEKIAFFGGTFDPVHLGHLITARAVAEAHGFDRVFFVPAACPPHKAQPMAPAEDRLAMLRLAIAGEGLFDICELELFRTGASYTYDTLLELRRRHGPSAELHWVVGADMLEILDTWHRVRELLDVAKIVVAARPPWDGRLEEMLGRLAGRLEAKQIEGIRRLATATPLIDIASSQIRSRAAAAQSIRYLVPDAVHSYILDHGLYR